MLPPSSISWLLRQPEDRVSQPKVMSHMLQSRYFLPALPKDEVFHASTVKVNLNHHLALLTSAIVDEIRRGFNEHWGTDPENWKRVNVWQTIMMISTRISVRVFFGADLAQDDAFIAHADAFSLLFTTASAALAFLVPGPLRPILGPVFTVPARYQAWRMNRKLLPLIKHRVAALASPSQEKDTAAPQPPNDILHQHILAAIASPNPAGRSPATIAARLQLILGFAAIPTTYLSLTNTIINLAASPKTSSPPLVDGDISTTTTTSSSSSPSPDALLALRAEAQRVLAANGGVWTRTSLLSLVRADSFVKETMRLYAFSGRGLLHEVVADEGVALPAGVGSGDEGDELVVVPKGAWLGVPVGEIHTDERVWGEGAGEFQAWRFVAQERVGGEDGIGKGGSSATTTSDKFLAFSRGKHVCPGRFFAVNVMKLVLAHVVMEYDIKPLEKRPGNVSFSDVSAPSDKAEIEVRKKNGSENWLEGSN